MKLKSRILRVVICCAMVIAVVVAWIGPRVARASGARKQGITKAILSTVAMAIQRYYKETGRWPESLEDLQKNQKGGPYMVWGEYPQQDAWRHKITYEHFDPSLGSGAVSSYGADGKPGGEGFAEDLQVRFGVDFPTWEQLITNAPHMQGGATGRQPFSSEPNRTSATTASRRSP